MVLLSADGALEAAPAMGAADIILDLVSTGVTLRENNLKQLQGGDILDVRFARVLFALVTMSVTNCTRCPQAHAPEHTKLHAPAKASGPPSTSAASLQLCLSTLRTAAGQRMRNARAQSIVPACVPCRVRACWSATGAACCAGRTCCRWCTSCSSGSRPT